MSDLERDTVAETTIDAHLAEPEEGVSVSVPETPSEEANEAHVESAEIVSVEPHPVLLAAQDLARSALSEVTPSSTIGAASGHEVHDERTLTHFFDSLLPGYPGWRWAATLTQVDDESEVTVLEVEMLPGETAVVAPEWVPWSERLASFRESQARQATEEAFAAEAAAAELVDEDEVDAEDDLLENDFSDYDDEIDGVDLEDLVDEVQDDEAEDLEAGEALDEEE